MRKIRTISELSSELDEEFGWRIQEIAALKRSIRQSDGVTRRAILRASLAITYAHWEGFVKNSSITYACYLSSTGLSFMDLRDCFLGVPARTKISQMAESQKSFTLWSSAVSEIIKTRGEKVRIDIEPHIKKIGNLNYDAFSEIANTLGVSSSEYKAKEQLIDERLLATRNKIAHGKDMEVECDEFDDVSDEVISLMRRYKNDIENSVAEKTFLVSNSP